jgi:hypothetical protein
MADQLRIVFFCHSGCTKIGDFVVDFLREFEAIFSKKALTRVAGPRGSCLMKTKQRVPLRLLSVCQEFPSQQLYRIKWAVQLLSATMV